MKVAIMGAGLSGLACAIALERNGIRPTVFESRHLPGDRFVNGEAMFHILNRPYNNSLPYFADNYDIHLQPVSILRNMTIYSEHKKATIKGHLGYTNIRGRHQDSYENQLASQVKGEIIYNSEKDYDDLLREFDYVVLATGDGEHAAKLGNYRSDLTVSLIGTTVEGKFTADNPAAWLNYIFAPQGYGYLIPFSDDEATIVIGYPDYPEHRVKDPSVLFDMFYHQVCKDTNQELRVTDRFEVHGYILGICNKAKIGNTYFVGNNFGSNMPAFGFGQFEALLTGILAAQDICGKGDYEELTKPLRTSYENSLILRKSMEKMDNAKLDLLVQAVDHHVVDKILDNEGSFDYMKLLSRILKPFV